MRRQRGGWRHHRHGGGYLCPLQPPKADIDPRNGKCPLSAKTGREQMQQTNVRQCGYSITSSASASNLSGIARPSIFAVLRLITNSNLVDCSTGRSAGFTPLRIFPV